MPDTRMYQRRRTFIVGVPLSLAALECLHPHAMNLMELPVDRWLVVHYAQAFLFPLTAFALAGLVSGQRDAFARVARISLFYFACAYLVFDTAAGIVVGELVRAAQASGHPETWQPAIEAVWRHPVVGSASASPPIFAATGTLAFLTGSTCVAICLKRIGTPWAPVLAVAAIPLGLAVFLSHAWPGGPITFATQAVAAFWVLLKRRAPLSIA